MMKQVIVMRTDLGMRKGKMVAQGAHASMGAVLPFVRDFGHMDYNSLYSFGVGSIPRNQWDTLRPQLIAVKEWLTSSFTKICLQTPCLEDLQALELAAREAGLITCLITDAGKTEFGGVPTITCCAIGPGPEDEIDKITGELRLL